MAANEAQRVGGHGGKEARRAEDAKMKANTGEYNTLKLCTGRRLSFHVGRYMHVHFIHF